MSETSKMGLFGSKEGNTSSSAGQLSKDESPERYAPYSVDSDSETYDTEALSIMDINDIIGIQTEPVGESTLESEIAALSEIITDTNVKDPTTENKKIVDMEIDAKLNVPVDNTEKEKVDTSDEIISKDLNVHSELTTNEAVETYSNVGEIKNDADKNINNVKTPLSGIKESKVAYGGAGSKDVTAISKSLQLIGEAYDSDDSQDSESNEIQIGKDPKVIFSCKSFMEKQPHKDTEREDCNTDQSTIIKTTDDLTSVIDDGVTIQMEEDSQNEGVKNDEEITTEKEKPESTEQTSEKNDCQNIVDSSSDVVRQISTGAIVEELSNVNKILPSKCDELKENRKSSMKTIDDIVETDSIPVVDDIKSSSHNQNQGIEEKNNDMLAETNQEKKPVPHDELIAMEVDVSEEILTYQNESSFIPKSKNDAEPQGQLADNASSDNVDNVNIKDPLEPEGLAADLVSKITESLVHESDIESGSTTAVMLEKEKLFIEEDSMPKDDEKKINVKSTEKISMKTCESGKVISETFPASVTNKAIEAVMKPVSVESSPVDKPQENVLDSKQSVEVEAVHPNTSENDEKFKAMNEDSISNDNYPSQIEKSVNISPELNIKQIVNEPEAPDSSSENNQSEECGDSATEFVDALSPTQFITEDISKPVASQKSQIDVIEKMDEETDNKEEFLDSMEAFEKDKDEIKLSISEIFHEHRASSKHLTETTNVISDSQQADLQGGSSKDENKVGVVMEESAAAAIETEVSELDTEELTSKLLSANSSETLLTPELENQMITVLASTDSDLPSVCDEPNIIESANFKVTGDEVTIPLTEELGNVMEKHLLSVPKSVENTLETINVPDLTSILEDHKLQKEDNDVTELAPLSEEISSPTTLVIDDMKQNLLTQSDELLEHALKESTSVHTDDSLDGILDLDLIPTIEEVERKSDESTVTSVVNNIAEEMDTTEKEPSLDILLPDTAIAAINQADDFLSDVMDTINDAENEVIDTDIKIKDHTTMETISSLNDNQNQPDNSVEMIEEQVVKELPEDITDVESAELEIPFTLTEDDKLEIPDEILNDPLAVVDSDIEVLRANTGIPDEILDDTLAVADSNIAALDIDTETTNDILNVPLIAVNSDIKELPENPIVSSDVLNDPLQGVESDIAELQVNTQVPNDILDDSLAVVDSAMEELQADAEISTDLLNESLTMVDSNINDLQEDTEISDNLLDDPLTAPESSIEVLQANTEISELESAVKFLQESEDHEIESPSTLSPKVIENITENPTMKNDSSVIYPSNQDICEDSSDLVTELETIASESIAISEAEIINEAAKLESEKKLNEEVNHSATQQPKIEEMAKIPDIDQKDSRNEVTIEPVKAISINIHDAMTTTQSILPVKSSLIPKTSILEERLREPPKIEIPIVDPPRLCEMSTTPKTSLLIPRDSRLSSYQKMMESPKSSLEKSSRDELKITDTSRKDSEKMDIENVGSPRIILKIAKSALADCAEPRSPKSPKIRSATNSPNPEDSPGQKLGKIKLKLSKGCHPSIIPNDNIEESLQWHTEGSSSLSPLGMKIKLSKCGDASIVQHELKETPKYALADSPRRNDSPLGMKIKLSKSGDASIIQPDKTEDEINRENKIREKNENSQDMIKRTDSPFGMKIKFSTTGDASIVSSEHDETKDAKVKDKSESHQDKRTDSHMGMKIKLSKKGGATIVSTSDKEKVEMPKSPCRTESPLGMKIKLSKTGDASIIHSELIDDQITTSLHESTTIKDGDLIPCTTKRSESSIGMKIKLFKDGDATIVHTEKQQKEEQQEMKHIDPMIGMKIKLSKSGDGSIIQSQMNETHEERAIEMKAHKSSDTTTIESMKIRLSKTGHGTIVANDNETSLRSKELIESHQIFSQKRDQLVNRSEVTIEPIQLARKPESMPESPPKRKDSVTLSPIETKKTKIDSKLSQMLPEVTIQPIASREKQIHFDQSNSSAISRQQLNVISQEISITQLRPNKPSDLSVSEKLRKMLTKPSSNVAEKREVIEHQPELIIVNENSNSSQDIMIIDEVTPLRMPEVKIPRKRGRPRRNAIAMQFQQPPMQTSTDPLALDDRPHQLVNNLTESKESERPRRTCRSQKSYAPPRRGRGRGRGKRKFDKIDLPVGKRARLDLNLAPMENCSAALITLDDEVTDDVPNNSSELYKALRQPLKGTRLDMLALNSVACTVALKNRVDALLEPRLVARLEGRDPETTLTKSNQVQLSSEQLKKDPKDTFGAPDNQNWLTPSSKKHIEIHRNDGMSTVQVIDEETRMSAESFSRSQTPARNMSVNAAETTINEESQGSVLSTATTESEKVKVRNRRMEISFDPDEGPFTVDKIAEYEWPIDRKGETFMIQEQISQYLGVKSFKRKYPDLKRRMVDMEERNFLRENVLVSEAMCDMGLTAIYSSEVLDIMCSDFPDQYEEYRKHMREKQIKEHSKKQKELSAAATAEKNRIDLAEMAVQSALSWNVNLNKARRESRRCSLDLQTFTIHVPKKLQKIEEESKVSHYPVALIPGQYTDYYREYTPAELRYYPLNTVLYGPMRPNERKFDSQSEGSQSDSDSDSSSDDSSCSSSEGTQGTEESQSTMDEVDIELSNQKDKSLKCKMCLKNLNKNSKTEVLIQCGTCSGHVHPSCIDLTLDMVPHIQAYAWQCTDCKTCAQCHDPADEDKMLFCDMCDRGYHIYCVGLRRVPQGRWHCQECAICGSCGSREAGGVNADRNSVALWQHEYKKGDKNTRVYVSTLCVPCSKLWRKGRYCPHCSRCHTVPRLDTDENLVHCSACDKYLHLECVESKDLIIDRKNYQCDLCIQNRQRIVKPSVSRVIRA